MKGLPRLTVLLAALIVLPGCYSMSIDATAMEPHVYLTRDVSASQQPERVQEFETEVVGSWVLFGLLPLSEPDIGGALQQEIQRAGGTAAINVEIVTQQTVLDSILSLVTLGIYGQRTTRVSGTVVR